MMQLSSLIHLSDSVAQARRSLQPVVALESTVITHGLPYPANFNLALDMEADVRSQGAVPATIAVVDGTIQVGLDEAQVERLAHSSGMRKISVRDFGSVLAFKQSGGTTVAATLMVAEAAELKVFATGGIGGVHRQAPFDISPDLYQLSQTPLVVVCAGAKAILDLPATIEVLETLGVPVVGYGTNEFPAFYSVSSGLAVSARADSPEQVAAIAKAHWGLGMRSAVLVVNPPPLESALPNQVVEKAVSQALEELQQKDIRGQAVSPYLLKRVSDLTGGASVQANLALLRHNARLAARIAPHLE